MLKTNNVSLPQLKLPYNMGFQYGGPIIWVFRLLVNSQWLNYIWFHTTLSEKRCQETHLTTHKTNIFGTTMLKRCPMNWREECWFRCACYVLKIQIFSRNIGMMTSQEFPDISVLICVLMLNFLRVVQRGVHFTFEFNLGERRIRHSHHENSITSQRIELRNSGSELPSGLPVIILSNPRK